MTMALHTRATAVFSALADGTRRTILELLRDGPRNVGELAARFEISQPAITHHLSVLRNAGLVVAERRGKHIYYSLVQGCLLDALGELLARTGLADQLGHKRKKK